MSEKWMVMVCPLDEPVLFVQRGKLCDTLEEAEIERLEWDKVYRHSKVTKCRPVDIKMYGNRK